MPLACASTPPPAPPFGYEKGAVSLHVKADPQLNLTDGTPHTLLLCVYELKDPNVFNQLAQDSKGLYKLLECGPFDGSVATAKRLIIHPDQDLTFTLDRAEGAKYVAVIAGYYSLHRDKIIRLFEVPVVVKRKGLTGKVAEPGHLSVDLKLGPYEIQ